MKVPKHQTAEEYQFFPLTEFFVILSIIIYLRIIRMVVNERETRALENMENMGMKKINYIGASLLFDFMMHFLLSLIVVPLIHFSFLKEINIFLIFFFYILFIYTIICIGYCVSSFFVSSKQAIIVGLCVYFVIYFF